jgi:transposase
MGCSKAMSLLRWLVVGVLVAPTQAAELKQDTAAAFDRYIRATEAQHADDLRSGRFLRRALYMPALVALRHEPHLRAFYQRLLSRGKAPLQAIVAVMRKLLHALFAMFRSNQTYEGSKLCPLELANKAAA